MPSNRNQWIQKNHPAVLWLTKRPRVQTKLIALLNSLNNTLIKTHNALKFHPAVERQLLNMNTHFTLKKLQQAATHLHFWLQQTMQVLASPPNDFTTHPTPTKALVKLIHDFIIEMESNEREPLELQLLHIPQLQELITLLPPPPQRQPSHNNKLAMKPSIQHPLEALSSLLVFFCAFFAGFFLDVEYDNTAEYSNKKYQSPRLTRGKISEF